ncbi:putative reverse transcriptase domain-containing protein [Tanacetum coccineum]
MKNNKNRGNQVGNDRAPAKVYALGHTGTNPDSNVVTGTFLLNNRYASILFDTGADRSFVSTAFSSQIDITPSILDHYYDVKLADGRIIGLNTILRGCTLNLLNYPFNVNLMPVELGSFDAIIVFLAHVTTKEVEDKSEKKRLEDVPIVRDFPEVFPEDLPRSFHRSTSGHYKSHLIHGYAPSSGKTEEIFRKWRSELGLAGYYRRFIKGFSKIAKSMTKLTQKGVKFDWGDKQEAAFQLLKQKLCSAPISGLYLREAKGILFRSLLVYRRYRNGECINAKKKNGTSLDDKLHFVEELVEIMDREVKQLKRSRIPIITVRWNFRRGPEFTWERED